MRSYRSHHDSENALFDIDTATWPSHAQFPVPVTTYTYQDIDEESQIRILRILPGTTGELLRCKLLTYAMPTRDASPSNSKIENYLALSYTWGVPDEAADYEIMMSDYREVAENVSVSDDPASFYVRHNLDGALRALRSEDRDVNVWVDALCINQQNVQEKTAQVARMDDVYSAAEAVCIWLGEGDDSTKQTFEFLRKMLNLTELDLLVLDEERKGDWIQVIKLLKNRWFTRRWVIQEIALATKAYVRCGNEEMDWQDFAVVIDLFKNKFAVIMQTLGNPFAHNSSGLELELRSFAAINLVSATSNLFHRSWDGKIQQRLLNLEVLVSSLFLQFEASEPRDIIYAALSLAKDTSGLLERREESRKKNHLGRTLRALVEIVAHVILSLLVLIFAKYDDERAIGRLNWDAVKSQILGYYGNSQEARLIKPTDAQKGRLEVCADFLEHFTATCQAQDIIWRYWVPSHQRSKPSTYRRWNAKGIDMRLIPDYSKSLTDVCADFMEYCIETSQSLDILCRHWAPSPRPLTAHEQIQAQQSSETLPSWILPLQKSAFGGPNEIFKVRRKGDTLVGNLVRNNHQHDCDYNASKDMRPVVKFQKIRVRGSLFDPPEIFDRILSIQGIALDTVRKTSDRVLFGYIPFHVFEFLGWTKHQSLNAIPDHLWRTLVADRGPNGTSTPIWYRRACLELFKYLDDSGGLNTSVILDEHNSDAPSTMVEFVRRVQQVIWDKKFFLNGEGDSMFGFAPGETMIGDVICILFGCSVPVVLRRVGDMKRFVFIGECYVHGMMEGQALGANGGVWEPSGGQYQTFDII